MIDYLSRGTGSEIATAPSLRIINHQLSIINYFSFAILSIRSMLRQE
jgi:hypothetical protein